MLYYTIYVKNLNNGTGYIDIALADDQLLKDYMQLLDVNVKPCHYYEMAGMPNAHGNPVLPQGKFAINLADVTAISAVKADPRSLTVPPAENPPGH